MVLSQIQARLSVTSAKIQGPRALSVFFTHKQPATQQESAPN